VPVGSAGVRFTGSAVLPVAVGTLTNFATVSNLHVYEVDAYTLWIEDSGVTDPEDWDPDADPDQDGRTNIEEFALSTDPANGGHGEAFVAVGDPDGAGPGTSALVMTIAVRENATFSPGTGPNAGDMIAPTTNVDYRVEGSFDLVNWTLAVSEVTTNAPFVAGLPPLQAGWEYRSFRVPGETAATQKAFLRVVFE
jgi:hypothetical protein